MAQTRAHAIATAYGTATGRLTVFSFVIKRPLSTTTSVTSPPALPSLLFHRRALGPLSHAVGSTFFGAAKTRFAPIRCRVNRSGGFAYSTLNSGSNFSDRPPTEIAPPPPGCDYHHWLIVMDKPGGEEEAKQKIYNLYCKRYFGFGCEIDEETSNKLVGLPGVKFLLPDSYADPEYKDYGAELFVNGEIVQRSPERQRRVEPQPPRATHGPRCNYKTWAHVRNR